MTYAVHNKENLRECAEIRRIFHLRVGSELLVSGSAVRPAPMDMDAANLLIVN